MGVRDGWERRKDYIDLDMAALTEMIQPVFPGRRVVARERLGDGLINTNYKIGVSGQQGAFVLRLYAREPVREIAAKEAAILQLVRERVPVPELLFADVEGNEYGQPYMLMRWVEGVMLKEVLARGSEEDVDQAGLAVGATLAKIASYTFPRAGFFGHGLAVEGPMMSMEEYIGSCLEGHAGERLGFVTAQRLRKMVTEGAHYLEAEVSRPPSLVHSDFQSSNILMRQEADEAGEWRTAAVLDWEWAHAGTPLFDIGILLRHDLRLAPAFEPAFVRGYEQEGGHLPGEWKRLSKLYDLVNLCEFLNGPDRRGSMMEDVKALVIETLERWDTLP